MLGSGTNVQPAATGLNGIILSRSAQASKIEEKGRAEILSAECRVEEALT